MSFYIEKIIVIDDIGNDSLVELSKGVNIVYGPSNTGKTCIIKCIDYMFGSDVKPIDDKRYVEVKIIVKTENGTISMCRKIGSSKINVISDIEIIKSGIYSAKANKNKHENTINFVWLSLIGIHDKHLIIKNENCDKQILSIRNFSHIFMITETRIISERSIILSEQNTSNTATISSLIFLLYGDDFSSKKPLDNKNIKEAKKNAIRKYISNELSDLTKRSDELKKKIEENKDVDIEQEIKNTMSKIVEHEKKLNEFMEKNQTILLELHQKNELLSECNMLFNRYKILDSQYDADLKRLNFIVDGKINFDENYLPTCPFCDKEVTMNEENVMDFIEAAKSEYRKIQLQSKDLKKAMKDICLEKNSLEKEIEELILKKEATEEIIETKLVAQISILNDKIFKYKEVIKYRSEIEILEKISKQKTLDIAENDSIDSEDESKFKVKQYLKDDFINTLTEGIKNFLEKSNYEKEVLVNFDKIDMDVIINDKSKKLNGKGYNAYLNSVFAIILSQYMSMNAKYPPNLLILDSPILSLKEKETEKPSEKMRDFLFKNIVENKKDIQTIVIENEIPDIDYKDSKIIHFTKDEENGRYGFLLNFQKF